MDMSDYQTTIHLAITISTVGGAWLTIRKIAKDAKKEHKEQAAEILQSAKEEDALLKARLEAKIETLKAELRNLESNVNKDMDHIRQTYNGEIKNLGQKIEDLRQELRNQHGQLVQLLTKMIDRS